MRRVRTAVLWAVILTLSYFYWKWVAEHVHDGKTVRAALVYFLFMTLGALALLAKIIRIKPPPV